MRTPQTRSTRMSSHDATLSLQAGAQARPVRVPPPSYGFQEAVDLKGGSNASARYHDDERYHGLSGH